MVPECPTPFLGWDLSLPLKSCSYCRPDRRCFKTLSWGQTIFTSHQVKQLLNGRSHLWISDQRILRYQVVLMDNPGLTTSPCEVLNPATFLPTSEAPSLFTLAYKLWTTEQNPKDCQKILWPILRESGTLMKAALSWMEKEELDMQ